MGMETHACQGRRVIRVVGRQYLRGNIWRCSCCKRGSGSATRTRHSLASRKTCYSGMLGEWRLAMQLSLCGCNAHCTLADLCRHYRRRLLQKLMPRTVCEIHRQSGNQRLCEEGASAIPRLQLLFKGANQEVAILCFIELQAK